MLDHCEHESVTHDVAPRASGCEECLHSGSAWMHLRVCLTCGHVGCCDSSRNRHALAHFEETGHPIVQSLEAGERWRWCYEDRDSLPDGRVLPAAEEQPFV